MKKIIMDECHNLIDTASSRLTEELRRIEGVPDVAYRVEGESVFVFDILLSIVKNIKLPSDPTEREDVLRVIVPDLLPTAYVSAIDAVTSYGITPERYTIVERDTGFYVKNTALKSVIPVAVASVEEAQVLLADVLVGKRIPTDHDDLIASGEVRPVKNNFVLAVSDRTGQHAMGTTKPTLFYAFGDQVFENTPNGVDEFDFTLPDTCSFFLFDTTSVANSGKIGGVPPASFREGCLLLSRERYAMMVEQAVQWFLASDTAVGIAKSIYADKQACQSLFTAIISETAGQVSGVVFNEDETAVVGAIRREFPELSGIHDADIYEHYCEFRRVEHYLRSVDASDVFRDTEYLFYFLGDFCQSDLSDEQKLQNNVAVGAIAAYFFSLGRNVNDVKLLAKMYAGLTKTVHRVMWDCRCLFDYLFKVSNQGGKITSGSRVKTLNDMFRSARTTNSSAVYL
ncbi:hypothetical protein JAG53_002066 [Proteus mirabilis]|nr:hypothetical protein [Proteus mirabilis]